MQKDLTFSRQAKVLLNNMPDFDKNDFTKWWINKTKEIGSNNILEYLIGKDNK